MAKEPPTPWWCDFYVYSGAARVSVESTKNNIENIASRAWLCNHQLGLGKDLPLNSKKRVAPALLPPPTN
jgi:hypothetical protein